MAREDVAVLDTPARLLRLLSLLQARPDWSGPELAQRLEVTTRTVRRDVDRLRRLGYPVEAAPGATGGYRLGTGGSLPPLLLDDEEATAVAIALGVTAGGAVGGMEEAALAALAKLDRLLPPRLRDRVAAVRTTTVRLGETAGDVDAATLVALAQASARSERLVITYRDRNDRRTERRIEPYRLVCTGRRWYLVAHDVDRRAWRTFRADRVVDVTATGHRFHLVDEPDAAAMVSSAVAVAPYRWTARVLVEAPVEEVRQRVPRTVGVTEAGAPGTSILTTGADHLDLLAGHLVSLGMAFEVLEPQELRDRLRDVGADLVARHAGAAAGPAASRSAEAP